MRLGPRSTFNLSTCQSQIQAIIAGAATRCDFVVVEGHIGKREALKRGDKFPSNKHHTIPARACNLVPMPMGKMITKKQIEHLVKEIGKEAAMQGVVVRFKMEPTGLHMELDES